MWGYGLGGAMMNPINNQFGMNGYGLPTPSPYLMPTGFGYGGNSSYLTGNGNFGAFGNMGNSPGYMPNMQQNLQKMTQMQQPAFNSLQQVQRPRMGLGAGYGSY